MKFDPIAVAKWVVTGAVGIGTSKIVKSIINTQTSPTTLIEKVTIPIATTVISAMAVAATKKHADEMVDDVVETTTKIIHKVKTMDKLRRINAGVSTFEEEGLDEADFEKDTNDNYVYVGKKTNPVDVDEALDKS